jgi:hypothetical protein
MSAREDMFEPLWQAYRVSTGQSPIGWDINEPITREWLNSYRDWGSPITEARDIGGDYTVQTFTHAVVSYHPTNGIAIETGPDS